MALPQKKNPADRSPRAPMAGAFDPGRLIQELLSLGHPRITMEVAQALTQEVAAVLGASPRRELTAPWVSQVVEDRLKNRGILGESRTRGLLQKGENSTLPTLEKFLASSTTPVPPSAGETPKVETPKTDPAHASPPRARLQISGPAQAQGEAHWQGRFDALAQRAASVESRFPSPIHSETLAVEFYNAMANQEFYPHAPELLQLQDDWQANGAGQLWMDLPLGSDSMAVVLREAQRIWRAGLVVGFVLRGSGRGEGLSDEGFEEFLRAVERTLLALPEHLAMPPVVGLHLEMNSTQALTWARLALSGKFYPKFSVCLSLPPSEARLSPAQGEELEDLLHQGPLLLHYGSSETSTFPRWGAGPELECFEWCQLGTLNLSILACGSEVDWVKLRRIIRTAVHFLDNLIEAQSYPLETVAERSRGNRKIGLGVMGFAELLIKLGIPYQSERALILAEKTMRFIQHEAQETSHQLAKSRGIFPNYASSPWKQADRKVRHRTLTAVCPAPSLAALAGVTPGVGPLESIFQWESKNGIEKISPIDLLRKVATQKKLWTKGLEEELQNEGAGIHGAALPAELEELFTTGKNIPAQALARIQGAMERPSDGSVGTCYAGMDSISEFLAEIFSLGLKQIHLAQNMRPRLVSLREEIPEAEECSTPAEENKEEELTPPLEAFIPAIPRPAPEVLQARTRKVQTFHGEMKVTLGFDAHGPLELSAQVGKAGSEASAQAEALSRLISLLLSVGMAPRRIYQELKDIHCLPPVTHAAGTSLPDGVAQILSQEFPETFAAMEEATEISNGEEITEISEAGILH